MRRTTPRWPVWPLSANVTTLLLLAAIALPAATACSVSSANRAALPPRRRDAPARVRKQSLLSRLPRPNRARRSLLKLDVAAAAAGSSPESGAARPAVLEGSQLKALVQLKEAWGMWAGNSNATTACSAWTGVTCSPKGLVTALDSKLFPESDPPPSGAIPASITTLATLQYLDLTYIDLVGPIPSLASLTALSHVYVPLMASPPVRAAHRCACTKYWMGQRIELHHVTSLSVFSHHSLPFGPTPALGTIYNY
ncbi:unnamed protein product [Closterium sp. Naga37s-1]|nr:unnamed protein product [Closterium sp. Naga37s-1]